MSTSGRINKSTTKFVPKRKSGTHSSQRAGSATPSLSGTPRLGPHSLPSLAEVTPWGTEQHSPSLGETFLAPRPPTSRTAPSPRLAAAALPAQSSASRTASFAPSDPSLKGNSQSQHAPQSSQTQSIPSSPQLGSSLGLGFGPSEPTASSQYQHSTQGTAFGPSQAPPSSPSLRPQPAPATATALASSPSRGTAFSVSLTGPPDSQRPPSAPAAIEAVPAPAAATSSSASAAAASTSKPPSKKVPLAKKAAAKQSKPAAEPAPIDSLTSAVAALIEEERGRAAALTVDEPPPETQREIEQEALALEAAAAASKSKGKGKRTRGRKAAEAEDAAPAEDEPPAAKRARAQGKGKQRASEQADAAPAEPPAQGFAPPDTAEGVQAKLKLRKPRAAKSQTAAPEPEPSGSDDDGASLAEPESEADESEAEEGVNKRQRKADPAKKKKTTTTRKRKADKKPLFPPDSDAEEQEQEDEGAGEGEDGAEPGEDRAQPAAAKRSRKSKSEKLWTQEELAALPEHEVIAVFESDGSETDSDGERQTRKRRILRLRTREELKMTTVEPAQTTMADIATAKDTIFGRESSRGQHMSQLHAKSKQDMKAKRAKMRERALKRHRREPVTDDDDGDNPDRLVKNPGSAAGTRAGSPAVLNSVPGTAANSDDEAARDARQLNAAKGANGGGGDDDGDDDNSEAGSDDLGEMAETQYAAQVRIVDGEIVLDESSLQVDRALDGSLGYIGPREVVVETDQDRLINNATWGKTARSEKWSAEETELFYEYLHQFGTDFEMIAALFPLRNRRQIKAKWTKEDRLHPQRITAALMQKKEVDLDEYARLTNCDLSGPIPEDPLEKIAEMRKQQEETDRANGGPVFGQPTAAASEGKKKGKKAVQAAVQAAEEAERARREAEQAAAQEDDDEEDEVERIRAEEARQAEIDAEIAAAEQAEKNLGRGKRKGKAKA